MSEQVFMWLGGTECELRPVSAADAVAMRGEAKKLAETLGGGALAESVSLAACFIARGAFSQENAAFSSADEVLKTLTLEELALAAAEYMPAIKPFALSDGETEKTAEKQRFDGAEDYAGVFSKAGKAEPADDAPLHRKTRIELTRPDGAAHIAESLKRDRETANDGTFFRAERGTMRETSRFFERDSRRFDGEFTKF